MLRFNAAVAWRLDPRYAQYQTPRSSSAHHMSRGFYDDHRLESCKWQRQLRSSLPVEHQKRTKTNSNYMEEFFEFMSDQEEYQPLLREFGEETDAEPPNGCWSWKEPQPWAKLMKPGDPDPVGAILAHFFLYMVFYRHEYQRSRGNEMKFNHGLGTAHSTGLPYAFRYAMVANPEWNDGIATPYPGLKNLEQKNESFRELLRDVKGWIPGGYCADVDRAEGAYYPVRQAFLRALPPNAHGLRNATGFLTCYNGGIRPNQACKVAADSVSESPPRPLRQGEFDNGVPRSRIEVLTRDIKSTDLHRENLVVMEGNGPGDSGDLCRKWLNIRRCLVLGNPDSFLGCTSESLQMAVNRAGCHAGFCSGFLSCTSAKVAKVNETVCDALIASGGNGYNAQELIRQQTGHTSFSSLLYLRPLSNRVVSLVKERPGEIESVSDLTEDELYPVTPRTHQATRCRRMRWMTMNCHFARRLELLYQRQRQLPRGPRWLVALEGLSTYHRREECPNSFSWEVMNVLAMAMFQCTDESDSFRQCVVDSIQSDPIKSTARVRDKTKVFRCAFEVGLIDEDTANVFAFEPPHRGQVGY
mmetsp:Transcript_7093/g.19816  ORF Transcript_7093/g.19816 Transcript_7093/m.19816 type:complete len:584 (+) Transcript_7093:159-1910(+)